MYSHFTLYLKISFLSLFDVFFSWQEIIISRIKQQSWYEIPFSISTTVVTITRTRTTITTTLIYTSTTVTIPQSTKIIPTSAGFIPAASQIPTGELNLETIKVRQGRAVAVIEDGEQSKKTPGRCSIGKDGKQTRIPESYPQRVDCTVLIENFVTRTIVYTASKASTITARPSLVTFTSTIFSLATVNTMVGNL